jgi:hypothetical protein
MSEATGPAGAGQGLTELRRSLGGAVLAPADEGFDAARRCFNALVDHRPAVIVRCLDDGDVGRAFDFARAHALEIAVRGGGHNPAGHCVPEGGLVIDLSLMPGKPGPESRAAVGPSRRRGQLRCGDAAGVPAAPTAPRPRRSAQLRRNGNQRCASPVPGPRRPCASGPELPGGGRGGRIAGASPHRRTLLYRAGRRSRGAPCAAHCERARRRRRAGPVVPGPAVRRLMPRCSGRLDHPADDPRVLADVADAGEAVLLEKLDRRGEQEAVLRLAAGGHLGDRLD